MKGYVVKQYIKSLDELPNLLVDTPEPVPKKGEVLIEVAASGLNFFDVLQTQGKYQTQPPFPWVAGFEFAGKVLTESPGSPFKKGARVFGAGQGAYAERIAVKWAELIPVPDNMSYEEAAGLYVTYPTSYAALVFRAKVQKGETVLVHAAAGGVGIAACQIAKALGAKVIATAGSDLKLKIAKEKGGADHGINYKTDGWEKEVKKLTNGKGVDVVYDPVGLVNKSLKCIAWNGRIVVVGFAAGSIEAVKANQVLLKNCAVMGVFWGAYAKNEPEKVGETWKALLDMFAKKQLKPVIYEKPYQGLESLAEGLKALSGRETYGKAVLSMSPKNKL